jgi:hypothetical protein
LNFVFFEERQVEQREELIEELEDEGLNNETGFS